MNRLVGTLGRAYAALKRRRWLFVAVQAVVVGVLLIALALAVRGSWSNAADRIRDARPLDLVFGSLAIAAYYLLFVVGWMRILGAWGVRISYWAALRAEMVSMLAKYIPGGVWTPAARVVAVRRSGLTNTPLVLASVLLEAGLSAVSGVLVFLVGMAIAQTRTEQLVPLLIFAAVVVVMLHPRVFALLARVILKPFGANEVPPLRWTTMVSLIGYYAITWVVGGWALWFMLRSLGAQPAVSDIPYLGGVAAVGAIVAVLAVLAPSGLGVREGSMYGLMLAIAPQGAALGVVVVNRLAITVVEAALLLVGAVAWRRSREEEFAPASSSSGA